MSMFARCAGRVLGCLVLALLGGLVSRGLSGLYTPAQFAEQPATAQIVLLLLGFISTAVGVGGLLAAVGIAIQSIVNPADLEPKT